MAGVISLGAETAYVSKPNILRPGSQADQDLAEVQAAVRENDSYLQPGVGGLVALVTTDTADFTGVANAETVKYNIPHASN